MAFTKALFYPSIDISNEAWLKNAMLTWNEIYTIVPSSIQIPYRSRASEEFSEAGCLLPLRVDPDMPEIRNLTDDVLKWIDAPESIEALVREDMQGRHYISVEKLPYEIRELRSNIHYGKLPETIRNALGFDRRGDWVEVDPGFGAFYMTLLATNLSQSRGLGLLTNGALSDNLANAVRTDGRIAIGNGDNYTTNRQLIPRELAQGTMANLLIEGLNIDPNTPVSKILQFREKYADQLAIFRRKTSELAEVIAGDFTLDSIRQKIEDISVNDVRPGFNSLLDGLRDCDIRLFAPTFLKLSIFSVTPWLLLSIPFGISGPIAIVASAGLSLAASTISYNRERQQILRENPYAYLYLAATELA